MSAGIRLLVLPRYGRLGASSRLRFTQYLPYLGDNGFSITDLPLLDDAYVRARHTGGIRYDRVLGSYARRTHRLHGSGDYDLIWVEQELLPWLPAAMELGLLPRSVPLVLDCDDAIFHRYDQHRLPWVRRLLGSKIDRLMQHASLALAGNGYLATRAREAGCRRVEQIPTVVDLSRYQPREHQPDAAMPTLGWIGSPATAKYLRLISPLLASLRQRFAFRCVAVGALPEQVLDTPFEAIPWTEDSEAGALEAMDIGLMPLADAPWEQGKCGYKLIQYMASGLPVIATPVGANREIISHGVHGFLAASGMEWESALQALLPDPAQRARMGAAGRRRVEQKYSLQAQAPRLAGMLRSLVPGKCAG